MKNSCLTPAFLMPSLQTSVHHTRKLNARQPVNTDRSADKTREHLRAGAPGTAFLPTRAGRRFTSVTESTR